MVTSFKETYIYSSKINPLEGEVFLVAKDFGGIDNELLDKIFDVYKNKKFDEFFINLPQEFIDDYTEIMSYYSQHHINYLNSLFYHYENQDYIKEINFIEKEKKKNNQCWITRFGIS